MSEGVRDMLVRGVAAAKAGERDEARFLLEWAERQEDASDEQRIEAWLWLSETTDDPRQKRAYIEQILAVDPSHPLARRGLAILQGRLDPEQIIDPDQAAPPVAQPAATAENVRRFVCPQCGGSLAYDAARHALACAYCGKQLWEHEAVLQGALVEEHDFFATLPTARAQRWALATERALACQGCGARIAVPAGQVSAVCPFCSSPHVVVAPAVSELIEPEGLLPFQFDQEQARVHVHDWLAHTRFRPGDLDARAFTALPAGVYLPFWTFDVAGQATWRAQVLESAFGGRSHAQWVPRDGAMPVLLDDLFVAAGHTLPAALVDGLGAYDTHALVPYANDLLAGWPAEIYQITMADASLVARQRALAAARADVERELQAYSEVRDLGLNSAGIAIESYKLVLLPVWIGSYRYQDATHRVVVNGQTGKVAGDVPRGGVQRILAGLFGG
jgi:predicted RNA-binding Zn-ribbon protein involved in translation (DUF1610 family)